MKTILFSIMIIASLTAFAEGFKIDDKATDFSLKNVDGKMVSMADYADTKGYIVIFTCNHCPYSVKYEDRIIALNEKYKSKGYPVIAISSNDPVKQPEDSYPLMQKRAKEKDFQFPYLYDETQEIASAYGATRTPHVFILEKDGNDLLVKYIGAIDNNVKSADAADKMYVEDAVDALLAGKDPDPDFTKAIGCTIKWADK